MKSCLDYLDDIVDTSRKIAGFIDGMSYDQFKLDDKTVFAVVRALEIIGEAAKQVPTAMRDRYSDVPWRSMTGMRDKLIHGYSGVDVQMIWKTITEDLLLLIPQILKILEQNSD